MNAIKPEGGLTIETVKGLGSEILAALESRDDLILDLSRVETVDAAGVQLLVSIVGECSLLELRPEILGSLAPRVSDELVRLGFVDRSDVSNPCASWATVAESLACVSGNKL